MEESSAQKALRAKMREINADESLTEQQKAQRRQDLLSGSWNGGEAGPSTAKPGAQETARSSDSHC